MDGRSDADALYRSTMHGEPPTHPDRLLAFRPLDPTNRPAPLKTWHGAEGMPLPREVRRSPAPAAEVLSGHRGESPALVDEGLLGTLLFLCAGVTRVAHTVDGEPIWFRASMSAGNLHPVEVYVVRDGVHHYDPLAHALVPLRAPLGGGAVGTALVLTGIPFRTCWKYGERGWRHLWWDAGCMLANLLAAADAHGVAAEVAVGFPDRQVADLVGIDGVDEVPLAVVHLDGERGLPPSDAFGPLQAEPEPFAPRVLRFPMVVDAQDGSNLEDPAMEAWGRALGDARHPAPRTVAPPPEFDTGDRVEDVILRRGSTRLFHRRTAPAPLLSWALGAATRAAPLDTTPPGTLLDHFVNVHDVAGIAPGGYRHRGNSSYEGPTRADDVRAYGARLCLNQPLGGDSAYTVFHSAALDPLTSVLGGRGYRAAMLEAGLAAGRLALNAVALGAGATGLTFYDGLVSRYFHTDCAPLLATAVGVPATAPAPSGTPGAPKELRGYGDVMARLTASLRGS